MTAEQEKKWIKQLAESINEQDDRTDLICEMANKLKDETKLPMNIWIDEAGSYIDGRHSKRVKFQLDKARKFNPHNCGAMDLDGNIHPDTLKLKELKKQDIDALRNFIHNNRYVLEKVADQDVFLYQIWPDMIKGGVMASENEISILNQKVDDLMATEK